jgi:RNA recognition motif-containing protein
MSNADDHAAAIAALNESELDGRTIYVSESVPKDKAAGNRTRDTPRSKNDVCKIEWPKLLSSLQLTKYLLRVQTTGSSPRGTKLYVGNLNFATTVEELQSAFAEYGEVKDVYLPSDYDGNPRGFAFVQMEEENALKAIEGLNGVEIGGRTLNVKKSLPKGTSNSR